MGSENASCISLHVPVFFFFAFHVGLHKNDHSLLSLPLSWGEYDFAGFLLENLHSRAGCCSGSQLVFLGRYMLLLCFLANLLFLTLTLILKKEKSAYVEKISWFILFKTKKDNLRITYFFLISVMKACNPRFFALCVFVCFKPACSRSSLIW